MTKKSNSASTGSKASNMAALTKSVAVAKVQAKKITADSLTPAEAKKVLRLVAERAKVIADARKKAAKSKVSLG